jgi:aryl-alcohol dehydrogenase-like predicted oxidoreductase
MEQRPLGHTEITVSELGLGTMTFGKETDEQEAARIVDAFLDAGGTLVDTADVYSFGASEEIVGRALRGRRDRVVLATKGRLKMGDDPADQGASGAYLVRAAEASLRRLGTDWIDLYQVHWPDFSVPAEDTLAGLDELVRAGKVRAVGVSNYLASDLVDLLRLSDTNGWARVASLQVQYSLAERAVELELVPRCQREGVALLPWSPLGGGVLTGKYRADEPLAPGTRYGDSELEARRLSDRNVAVAAEVRRVAERVGRTPAQVALNWVLRAPGVTAPIIGVRTAAQLEDNLGAAGWRLDPEHVAALDRASRSPLPYPHNLYRVLGFRSY